MMIYWLLTGLIGFSSVAIGAIGEHALKARASEETMRIFMTALRYHQLYAVLMVALVLALSANISPLLNHSLPVLFWIFTAGLILFSGSIYISAFSGIQEVTYASPFGGIALMAGWLYIIYIGIRHAMV